MTFTHDLSKHFFPAALIALLLTTRFHHFGDTVNLPDASLAVFFFAGFYRASQSAKALLFGLLLALSGFIDYLAIASGTSGWCVSPAYVFLVPTYAVMMWAGHYCASLTLALRCAGLLIATTLAFIISNGSFFLFSGRFAEMSWLDYSTAVSSYFLPYMGWTVMYALMGLLLAKWAKTGLVSVPKEWA